MVKSPPPDQSGSELAWHMYNLLGIKALMSHFNISLFAPTVTSITSAQEITRGFISHPAVNHPPTHTHAHAHALGLAHARAHALV